MKKVVAGISIVVLMAFLSACASKTRSPLQEDLMKAIVDGNAGKVKSLLEKGANPNTVSTYKSNAGIRHSGPPVIEAAHRGQSKVLRTLLEAGANPDITKNQNDMFLATYGVSEFGKKNWTALHHVALTGNIEETEILLEHGADPNVTNSGGNTPLHFAALEGHLKIAKLLVEAGAKLMIRNNQNKKPKNLADDEGNDEVKQYLMQKATSRFSRLPEIYEWSDLTKFRLTFVMHSKSRK